MRFSIQKDLLQKAIDVAILAVDTKENDVRSTFLFDVRGEDELILWSTDRQMMTKVPTSLVPDSLQGTGQFTVEASRLQKWIKNVPEDVVDVEVKERTITMNCGSAKGHFASRDPVEFPDFQAQLEEPTKLFSGNPETFVNALKFVAPFIGKGTSNNEIANNMQVTELRGREMLATDSLSVSLYIVPEDNENLDAYEELLAGDDGDDYAFKVGAGEIRNLTRFLEKTCATEFTVSKKDVYLVESDDGSVFGYNAPIYKLPVIKGIPKELEEPEVWTLDKKELISAVKTLTATADPDDVALTMSVTGDEGEEGTLTLSMKDALERNDSTYQMPVVRDKVSQDVLEFVVNCERLVDPLSLYEKDELTVGINAHDGAKVRYFKYYEANELDEVRVCIVTLRMG